MGRHTVQRTYAQGPSTTRSPLAGGPVRNRQPHIPSGQTQALRGVPHTRRYEISYLSKKGEIESLTKVAPAAPPFEDAFAAFGRGALISTPDGPVAVEDLLPGTLVDTADNGPKPVVWTGSMTLIQLPSMANGGEAARLTRLAPDALGLGRPHADLVLGPKARVLFRDGRCQPLLGAPAAFAPAHAFADGMSVIEITPATPVRVHHIALESQQTLLANGIEVESYHPGPMAERLLDPETRAFFMALFPCFNTLRDFGVASVPRLTAFELEGLRAA